MGRIFFLKAVCAGCIYHYRRAGPRLYCKRINSPLTTDSATVMPESSYWLGKNIVWSSVKRNPRKTWTDAPAATI